MPVMGGGLGGGGNGTGTKGDPGLNFLSGTGPPANTLGRDGETYHNEANGDLYKKAAGAWTLTTNIRGAAGAPGLTWRGPWSGTTAFAVNDAVTHPTGTYRRTVAGTTAASPFTDTTNWSVLTPNPRIVTGLDSTAVRAGNFCILRAGATALVEVHPTPTDVEDGEFYYKDADGAIWGPGGAVPYATGGLTTGQLIVATGKPNATGRNWTPYTLPLPADVQPTATRSYFSYGMALSATEIDFEEPVPLALEDATAPIFDNLSTYTLDTPAALDGVYSVPWTQLWSAATGTSTARPPLIGTDASFPLSRFLRCDFGSTGAKKVVVREDSAALTDVELAALVENDSGTVGIIRLYARVSGGVGTETGIALQININAKTIRLVTVLNGVETNLKNAAGADILVNMASLAQGAQHYARFRVRGTRMRGKVWQAGTAEPAAWTVEGFQSTVTTPGKVGIGGDAGYVKVGLLGYSKNTLPAPVS